MKSKCDAGSARDGDGFDPKRERSTPTISQVRPAGVDHQVVTVIGGHARGKHYYCKSPCSNCPWRRDAVGIFPPEAFRHSAETAYDMSMHMFACHQSGAAKPATCAGFLLRGAAHNLAARLAWVQGRIKDDVDAAGADLFESYREMAVANGVDASDPILRPCR